MSTLGLILFQIHGQDFALCEYLNTVIIILSGAVWVLMDWRDGHSPPHGRSTQFGPTPERCQHHGNQHRLLRDAAAAGPGLPILHSHVAHGTAGV